MRGKGRHTVKHIIVESFCWFVNISAQHNTREERGKEQQQQQQMIIIKQNRKERREKEKKLTKQLQCIYVNVEV